jgi:hypothetical protein
MIRTFSVNDNGAPDLNSMTKTFLADMVDKNLFSVYECQLSLYHRAFQMIGGNTWTGKVAIYTLDMERSPRRTGRTAGRA